MKNSENINISWAKVAQAIMIITIMLTIIAASVFLFIFSKGLLSNIPSSTPIIMIAGACITGLISVLLLKNIAETNVNTDKQQPKYDTVVLDHTQKDSSSSRSPKLNIPKDC